MDSAKTAANALKTIQKNGRTFTITRTARTMNQITGQEMVASTTPWEIVGIVLPRYKGTVFAQMDEALRQGLVTGRLRSMLCAAAGMLQPPKPLDVVTIDGNAWEVVGVTELAPDGTPILYTIGVVQK